jgi:hypothetical protein
MFYRISLIVLGYALFAVPLFAEELSPELQKKADSVFQGFDDTIMRINSGVCRITGKTIEPNGNKIDDDIFIAFDYNANFYSFENGNLKRALLTPEFFYEIWHPNTSSVSVKRSSASSPESTSAFCYLVDIQNIFTFIPVGPHKPYAYQQSVFHSQNNDIIKTNYEELTNGLVKVTTVTPPSVIIPEHAEYIVDKNKGYTVQQIKRDVGYVFELSWKNINQTWVPVAYVFKSGPKFGNFGVEWKIEWEQVNRKVDPKMFDLEEVIADQEDGAIMLSGELGSPPLIIGKVGKGFSPLPEKLPPKSNYRLLRYTLIVLGLIMIIISIGKKIYDWRTRQSK